MPSAATITSIGVGTCTSHENPISMTGFIITGSSNTIIGNSGSAYTTSIVLGYCGHIGIIVSGSSSIRVNSSNKARIGSIFVGAFTGIIVTGFPGVEVGG